MVWASVIGRGGRNFLWWFFYDRTVPCEERYWGWKWIPPTDNTSDSSASDTQVSPDIWRRTSSLVNNARYQPWAPDGTPPDVLLTSTFIHTAEIRSLTHTCTHIHCHSIVTHLSKMVYGNTLKHFEFRSGTSDTVIIKTKFALGKQPKQTHGALHHGPPWLHRLPPLM